MIAVEVFRDPAAIVDHRAAWNELFQPGRHEPSTSFEWVQALSQTHLASGDEFFLVVLRRRGRVCGLVPLVASRERVGGVTLTTLAPLAERYRTHSDLLLSPADEDTVGALLEALLALPCRWDMFRLIQVLEANPILAALATRVRKMGLGVRVRDEAPSFFLPLPETFDDYLAARSSKFRNHLRRVKKKLAATGTLRVLTAGVDLDFEAAYEALLAIEGRSWKHAHGTAISAIARQAAFYRTLASGMLCAGRLHLTLLMRDTEPIAYNLGLVCGGQYAYLKTSFVDDLRPLGPATILRARLFASLIEQRVTAVDFPAEPYDWEAQWTRDVRPHRSIVIFNRTWRARGWAWLQRWRDARRPVPAPGAIAFANPRDLRPPADDEDGDGEGEARQAGRAPHEHAR